MVNLKVPYEDSLEDEQPRASGRRFGRWMKLGIITLVLVGLWFAATNLFAQPWRAVFLENNQVYFGTFTNVPFASAITLRNVYYLQVNQPLQPDGGEARPELKLVKLGSELHGPTDMMVIPKKNILFWEDLRDDSVVVKSIREVEEAGK